MELPLGNVYKIILPRGLPTLPCGASFSGTQAASKNLPCGDSFSGTQAASEVLKYFFHCEEKVGPQFVIIHYTYYDITNEMGQILCILHKYVYVYNHYLI